MLPPNKSQPMRPWDALDYQLGYKFLCWHWDHQVVLSCNGWKNNASIGFNLRWIVLSSIVPWWILIRLLRRRSQRLLQGYKTNISYLLLFALKLYYSIKDGTFPHGFEAKWHEKEVESQSPLDFNPAKKGFNLCFQDAALWFPVSDTTSSAYHGEPLDWASFEGPTFVW